MALEGIVLNIDPAAAAIGHGSSSLGLAETGSPIPRPFPRTLRNSLSEMRRVRLRTQVEYSVGLGELERSVNSIERVNLR